MKEQEPTHSFELADVEKYKSIEKALLMKEFRRMSIYKKRHDKEGWVYYSSRALEDKFPYMTKSSIHRWLDELVEDGYLLKQVDNRFKYDKTYSFLPTELAVPKWESVSQNGTSMSQNGTTIPPLSTPQSNIVLHSQNALSSYDDDSSIEMVDDNGDPIVPRSKKTKDPLIEFFRSECKKQVGITPVIPQAAARTMLITARKHLTDKQIEAMFKDWFALGKPDNETLQITRALSTARINTFKADNGIK